MELIVDGKNVLEPVNLEKNKNEIMQQRASVPSQVSLTHFKENVGFFKANVKGDDMNDLVTELQKTFSDINIRESKVYDQLDMIFKTIESIHKGSIEGVIVGVKSAQEAISQAEYAISTITDTLTILQDFKSQLEDNTEHLDDIDLIWDATQQLDKNIQRLETTLIKRTKNIETNIKVLMDLKSMLDKIKHIKDIDTLHSDLRQLKKTVEKNRISINKEVSLLVNGIKSIETDVKVLKELKSTLDKIKHLKDVDTLHSDLTFLKKKVETDKISVDEELSLINAGLKKIYDYKDDLEKQQHLFDIDGLWSANNDLSDIVVELENVIADDNQKIQSIDDSINKNVEDIIELKENMEICRALDNEVILLKEKVKLLYYVLGGTIGIIVLQLVLNVLGVL